MDYLRAEKRFVSTVSLPLRMKVLNRFQIEHPGINFLRLQWLDYSAVRRGRVLSIKSAVAHIAHVKPLKAHHAAMCISVDNKILPTSSDDGMYWLVPDW